MHLVTKSEFARMTGVSVSAITYISNGRLRQIVHDGKIDITHPDAILYMERCLAKTLTGGTGMPRIVDAPTTAAAPADVPEDFRELADLTLREIIEQYGTEARFLGFLKASHEIEKVHEARLKNAEREGELVTRDLVLRGVIEPYDTAHTKLLTDGARKIATRLKAKYDAGMSVEDAIVWTSKQIGTFIKAGKEKAKSAISDHR